MINMNLPAVVTQPSIYPGCYTRKMFWEEKFTGEEKFFLAVNVRNFGCHNVRKHKQIKGSDKYVTLDISLNFDKLEKMKIKYLESKGKLGRSGKELVTALAFKTKVGWQKYKKVRYAIRNISKKDLQKIIKEFEKIGKVPYVKRIPKNEPTSRYYHLVSCIAECMMRYDEHNRHVHGSYVEETSPSYNVNVTDDPESK